MLYNLGAHERYWVNWPEHVSKHKPLYNVEEKSGTIILSLYMSVRGI